VADVRGYADQRLRKPEDPTSASNRRVSIVVKYQAPGDPHFLASAVPAVTPQTAKTATVAITAAVAKTGVAPVPLGVAPLPLGKDKH
jgi:hypothetical protein